MKYVRSLFVTFLFTVSATDQTRSEAKQHTEDFAVREVRESLQRYGETLAKIDSLPPTEAIPKLAEMMVRTSRWQDEMSMAVFSRAEQKLLSIPGHAYYYRDKINAAKPKLRNGEISLNDWFNILRYSFETLKYMPSEEAVEVLGEFGKDQFGLPGSKNPDDYKNIPGIDAWDNDLSSAGTARIDAFAYNALDSLGIEPPPSKERNSMNLDRVWGPWWEEVKSGKRKYRFKGSSVEHPVKPPPGVREVHRPDRHPGTPSGTNTAEKPDASPSTPARKTAPLGTRWPFIAGIAGVLLAAAVFLIKMIRRK